MSSEVTVERAKTASCCEQKTNALETTINAPSNFKISALSRSQGKMGDSSDITRTQTVLSFGQLLYVIMS